MKNAVLLLLVAVIIGAGVGFWDYQTGLKRNKIAYVINTKVFDGFTGTKEKQKALKVTGDKLQFELDSIVAEIKIHQGAADLSSRKKAEWLKVRYDQLSNQYEEDFSGKQTQYNEELWKQINQYMVEYGSAKGYDMIYGASGNGSIMYADSSLNVSDEFIQFINKRYEGK